MLVLCDNCSNHYDDQTQRAKCPASDPGDGSYKRHYDLPGSPPAPIETHRWAIESLYGKPGGNPRMTGESWPQRRTPKGRRKPSGAPTTAAGGVVVPLSRIDRSNR